MASQSQQLDFAIRAVNESQRALKDVQSQLGDVGEAAERSSGRMGKLGGALGDVAKIAGGMLLAQGLTQLPGLVSSISARATELELQGKKAATVFGESLGTVQAWAKESASAMGLSSREATNLAVNLGDLLIPMGFAREEAAALSAKTINLAGALSEWSSGTKSAAEVADVLTKAYLGETDGLKALGIAISAAEIEAALMAKGQKNLTGEALAQAKALAIQELIFAKSGDAQAAFAEGAGSAARKQAELRAAMKEAKDELSMQLQPAMTAITAVVATQVVPAISALVKWLSEDLAPAIRRLWEEWGPKIQEFWELQARPALEGLVAAIDDVVTFVREHWAEISAVMGPVFAQIWLYVETTVRTLANLISFIVNVLQGDWLAAWQDIQDVFRAQWDLITGSIGNLEGLLRGIIPLVRDAGRALGAAIIDGITDGIGGFSGLVQDIAGAIGDAVRRWINWNVIDRINRSLEFSISIPNPLGPDPTVHINPPDIPYLGRGGIVVAGDNPSGIEAIVPLERAREFGFVGGGGGAGAGQTVNVTVNMPNYLGDRREVARELARELGMVFA